MKKEQPMSGDVLEFISIALSKGEHWMAYNTSLYFIDKSDVYFFSQETDAIGFANDNISDHDNFSVMRFDSIQDVLKKIPYGEKLNRELVRILMQIVCTICKAILLGVLSKSTTNKNNYLIHN